MVFWCQICTKIVIVVSFSEHIISIFTLYKFVILYVKIVFSFVVSVCISTVVALS